MIFTQSLQLFIQLLHLFISQVGLGLIFYSRRFYRRFVSCVCCLCFVLWVWSSILSYREGLTGSYCKYSKSKETFNRTANSSVEQLISCSFDRIDECQLIENRSLLYTIKGTSGFASELNNMLNAFAYSVATRRRFLIDGQQWNYGPFEDYFDIYDSGLTPYSSMNCKERTFYSLTLNHDRNDRTNHLMISRDSGGMFSHLTKVTHDFEQRVFAGLLSIQRKRQITRFLWKYLKTQNIQAVMAGFLRKYSKFGSISTFYGLHIRQGDKMLTENPKKLTVLNYILAIETLIKKPQNRTEDVTIFVASDAQQSVIEQLKLLRLQWNFLHLDYDNHWKTSSRGHHQSRFNQLPNQRKFYETNMFVTELIILSQTRGVVCTFTSNICRFLQLLRNQSENTLLSLNSKWHPT